MPTRQLTDVAVRIGELEGLPADSNARLITVGLGSCVGVAMIDTRTGNIALAHVFLPEMPPSGPKPGAGDGTYASRAVPALVERLKELADGAASTRRFVAVIAGGAKMFGARPGQDVGERNVAAVRAALATAGIDIVAEDVGGTSGRTVRVDGGTTPGVQVRVVGTPARQIWGDAPAADEEVRRAA